MRPKQRTGFRYLEAPALGSREDGHSTSVRRQDNVESQQETAASVANRLFLTAVGFGMGDALWKAFQYKGRPKHGILVNRLRPERKVAKEHFLFKEFVLVTLVLTARAVCQPVRKPGGEGILARVIELLIDGPPDLKETWREFSFPSRSEAVRFYREGLSAYLHRLPSDDFTIFVDRYHSAVGGAEKGDLFACMRSLFVIYIPLVRRHVSELAVKITASQEVTVSDDGFLQMAAEAAHYPSCLGGERSEAGAG